MMNRRITILFYNRMYDHPLEYPKKEISDRFFITENKSYFRTADVVVFHLPTLVLDDDLEKPEGQLWVAWYLDCETCIPWFFDQEIRDCFDLTVSYRLGADVPVILFPHYQSENFRKDVKVPPQSFYLHLNDKMNHSLRLEYILELMKYIDADSYGGILNNRRSTETGSETMSRYKFTLVFEDFIAQDYVTDAFCQPMLVGSVPVYMGAPNIRDFAPDDNCFVNAADFENPRRLAEYLTEMIRTPTEYLRLLAWRDRPLSQKYVQLIESQKTHWMVRLCHKISERL